MPGTRRHGLLLAVIPENGRVDRIVHDSQKLLKNLENGDF